MNLGAVAIPEPADLVTQLKPDAPSPPASEAPDFRFFAARPVIKNKVDYTPLMADNNGI